MKQTVKINKYRSNFEVDFARNLEQAGTSFEYEADRFEYVISHSYKPDFKLAADIYFETKGLWKAKDRTKLLEVHKQHPHIVIVMCFQNPSLRLSKSSKTTYSKWCNARGILWCKNEPKSIAEALVRAHRLRTHLQAND